MLRGGILRDFFWTDTTTGIILQKKNVRVMPYYLGFHMESLTWEEIQKKVNHELFNRNVNLFLIYFYRRLVDFQKVVCILSHLNTTRATFIL